MRKQALLVVSLALISGAVYAAKKPTKTVLPPAAGMTPDQKVLHALNRLTFGPRPGDIDAVKQQGLNNWIEAQLHPESIPENPLLEAKLLPLDSLRMTTAEMLRKYPSAQMVKAMADGRLPLPSDPQTRAAVSTAIERLKLKKSDGAAAPAVAAPAADEQPKAADAKAVIASLPLSEEQRATLLNGTPQDKLATLQSLPPDQLNAVLAALPPALRARVSMAGSPEMRRKVEAMKAPMQVPIRDLTEGKLLHDVYSNRQLEEVLTDFWYNHFNVFVGKGADRDLVTAYERDTIRPNVLGKFKDLLLATAKSPAMLFYLDNWQSVGPDVRVNPGQKRRAGLNENYGRELMELHTLGVDGGYTQADVTEVARCFTGWTILQPQRGGEFTFNARMHDKGEKHVLGVTIPAGGGMDDGLKVLDILVHHPATARFISKSLAILFVSDNPPDSLVNKMAATFTATDGDLREVLRTMFAAPEFWDPAMFRTKVKSPLEMVVSAIRAVNGDLQNATAVAGLMNQLGEPLYRKQEPTGYSNRGADWLNSASLLARMNFANSLAQGRIPGIKVDTAQFAGDAAQIERSILLTDASADSRAAIQAGLDERQAAAKPASSGPLVAGLTLGSPDFQRR